MTARALSPEANEDTSAGAGLTRRQFLVRAAAAGGFMIGAALPDIGRFGEARAQGASAPVTAWIVIGADESITVLVPITEMGQGTMTGLATLVADQLQVDWSRIRVQHAPVDAAHGGANANIFSFRFTGGSLGMRLTAQVLQQAAANARVMLVNAGAALMGTQPSSCAIVPGSVTYVQGPTNKLSYGAIAPSVAGMPAVANAPLLTARKYAGAAASPPRVDVPAKVNGSAVFGIDVWQPGMVFAAVKHCPTSGGTVGSVGSTPAGTLKVVKVGGNGGSSATAVAVVAATTWDAMRGAKNVSVNWTLPTDVARRDTAAINARAAALMAAGAPMLTAQNTGSVAAGMAAGVASISQSYQVPYLAHAAMEPMNCTVRFTPASGAAPARCEMWAPTQAPDIALGLVRAMCPAGTNVTVVNTLVGGGFGRKFETDFLVQAMHASLACPGMLVKLTWPREQDFSNDQFRPMALTRITAAADANGAITAWNNRIVTPSIAVQRTATPTSAPTTIDGEAVHGAISRTPGGDAGLPYKVPNSLVEWVWHDSPIPVGYWRSVGMSFNTFAVECAIDELATALKMDPIAFRRKNLAETRLGPVLDALATLSNWSTTPASGRARGVAIAAGFGSFVGQVAEISVNATSGAITVHRVSTVIDCGTAMHRDAIRGQVEGAVAQAMAAALWEQQTWVNGVPQVTNWNRYRTTKLSTMPQIDVQILEGGGLGGVGEVGVPCVAPAIANAYAKLFPSARKRSLPFFPGTTMGGL